MNTREVVVSVTFLEMTERPSYPRPSVPGSKPTALIAAEDPPEWWFLALYNAVGKPYHWTEWNEASDHDLTAFVKDPKVTIFTLMYCGWPAGFFMLDTRLGGICDLSYFGLVQEAIGLGLGKYLLQTAIHAAWDQPGVEKVTVNTCTLDHPRALPLYQKMGFVPVNRQDYRATIPATD